MFRPLYPADALRDTNREVNVILVPGVGTPALPAWQNETGRWLENLARDCSDRVQIWKYEYTAVAADRPLIQQLAQEAEKLLDALNKLCTGSEAYFTLQHGAASSPPTSMKRRRKPLFFICHSLGGVILKCALSLTKDHIFRHLDVIEVISGFVFLGTPHLPLTIEASPNILELILQSHQKSLPPRSALTVDDNVILAKFCHDFGLLGIQVPIVSAYETVESRVYQGMFAKYRKPRQVPIIFKERCVIGSRNEVIVGASQDHNSICKVQVGEALYYAIENALQLVLKDAPDLIYGKFHTSSRDAHEMGTVRSQTTDDTRSQAILKTAVKGVPLEVSQSHCSSKDAIFGSSSGCSQGSGNPITTFELQNRNPRLPCFYMRTHKKRSDFFGRQDVFDLIDESLLPGTRTAGMSDQEPIRSFALCGMGGIGKTQIAVEYAYTRRSKYDAVFWVTADDKNILSEEFARIAVDLGLEERNGTTDLTSACELVKGWLSNPVRSYECSSSPQNEASWLLIFDNADNLDVLEEFWPTTGLGAVLTTSRDSLAKNQTHTANKGIDLQPFSDFEAAQFMKSLTRKPLKPGQDKYVAEVVNKLGGLPLLITQMAGVMNRLRLSYTEFLALCNESGLDRVSRQGGTTATTAPGQMHSISYGLGLDGLASGSLGLLYLISMLDPDRIPERILTGACSMGTLEYLPKGLSQYYEARAQLLQTSLISQNPETCDIWIHRIVQEVVREKMDNNLLVETFNVAIHAVSSVWPFSRLETRFSTGRYNDCASLFPSAVRLKNAYQSMASLQEFHSDLSSAKLFNDTGWYWFERGFQEESKEWFGLVQKICDGLQDKSSEDVAYLLRETHHNQGTAAGETNDTKTFLKHSKIWLDMMLQRRTENGKPVVDYELCIGYNEVGVAHAMNGEYEVATTYFVQAIDSFQALPNYEDTMLGWTESNIGLMYWMLGSYDDAERALLEIIDIYRVAHGVDDTLSFKTGKMLYALGNVYVSQGKFEKGLEFHTRCLKQYRATLGDKHHRIGDVCHRLADDNIRFGNNEEARALINQALKVFSGRPHYKQELARSTYKAAQVSQAMGNESQAASEFREAFSLRRCLLPDDERGIDELTEADFDKLVVFWSR